MDIAGLLPLLLNLFGGGNNQQNTNCIELINSQFVNNEKAISCNEGFGNKEGECKKCSETYGELCTKCNSNGCIECLNGIINEEGKCSTPEDVECILFENSSK